MMIHKIKVCSQNDDIINKVIAPNINQRKLKRKQEQEATNRKESQIVFEVCFASELVPG